MKLAAICHRLPSKKVVNAELIDEIIARNSCYLDFKAKDSLRKRLQTYFNQIGLISRYHRAKGEKAVLLGMEAAQSALKQASAHAKDIDLLIYVGVGRGWLEPAMANLFISELGMRRATGFDVLDACASWLRALDIAKNFITSGKYRNVLILNCEFNFREYANFAIHDVENLDYLLPTFTIGEAATATLITADYEDAYYYSVFKTWGKYHNLCKIPLPNQNQYILKSNTSSWPALKFYAYGTRLSQIAVKRVLTCFRRDPQLQVFNPEICFAHSVSEAITTQVERLMGFPSGIFYRIFSTHGNTVSASVPLAMSLAFQNGDLKRGQPVLLIVGSAGFSVGFSAFTF